MLVYIQGIGEITEGQISQVTGQAKKNLLRKVAKQIDSQGQCPVCEEWAEMVNEYGVQVYEASLSSGVREVHTSECCILTLKKGVSHEIHV